MKRPADEPIHHEPDQILDALDGPADQDLHLSGPGDEGMADPDDRLLPDHDLPGGIDHTTAAVGAGGVGLALLGIAGFLTRRRNRRRTTSIDE